ncbi:hypothetical protein [Caballeronia sp. LZ065]|uniref:hypothetical protein n=1 Tax=Caballeronia sp. LZ065 TaxID=3038571 RepID=UPI00286C176A|nr:hypothetical protein [Caballeronia sp. LZ065]
MDITDRLTRVCGTFSTGTNAGRFTVPAVGDVWFALIDNAQFSRTALSPVVTMSGKIISWTFPDTQYGRRAVTVMYGVY